MEQNFKQENEFEKVVLVGVDLSDNREITGDFERSMDELAELAKACFMEPVAIITQKMVSVHKGLYIGLGKVQEVKEVVKRLEAQLVIFDDSLTPSQLRNLQDELETAYNYKESSIIKTGKNYTIDSRKWDEYNEPFKELILEEYLFSNGKRYVRVKTNSCYNYSEITLSNGKRYKNGDYVWVEVSPIKWLIDEKNDIALSEKILFAGVQFNHEKNYKGDFDRTDIKWFMDTYFVKEIIKPSIFIEQLKEQFDKTK